MNDKLKRNLRAHSTKIARESYHSLGYAPCVKPNGTKIVSPAYQSLVKFIQCLLDSTITTLPTNKCNSDLGKELWEIYEKYFIEKVLPPQFLTTIHHIILRNITENLSGGEFEQCYFSTSTLLQQVGIAFAKRWQTNRDPVQEKSVIKAKLRCDSATSSTSNNRQNTTPNESYLHQVFDIFPDPVFVKDEQHRWILLNKAFARELGYPLDFLLGRSDFDVFPREKAEAIWANDDIVFNSGESLEIEERYIDRNGDERIALTKKQLIVDRRGERILVGVIRDITDRKHAEEKIQMAERIVSVGTLAAGVAHEINNPLSFVLANLEWMNYEIEGGTISFPDDDCRMDFQSAVNAAQQGASRVQHIVKSVQSFSNWDKSELAHPVNVSNVVEESLILLQSELKHRVVVDTDLGQDLWIDGTESQLAQVVVNVIKNAMQAIGGRQEDNGCLKIKCHRYDYNLIIMEFSDNGGGIDPFNLKYIYDPFFTTRAAGSGLGLGLTICHNIIDRLGGAIDVNSVVGEGTTVQLMLPVSKSYAVTDSMSKGKQINGSNKTHILIVDDEPELLMSLKRILREFEVVTCDNVREALAAIRAGTLFDVIVCDLLMPEMTGAQLYDVLAVEHPDLAQRMIFLSGGAFLTKTASFIQRVPNLCLDKPMNLRTLKLAINQVLEKRHELR